MSPALSVAYPNVDFTPPTSGGQPQNYLSVRRLPNTTQIASIGKRGDNRHFGILQIMLHARKDQDISVSNEIAGLIVQHFKPGTAMVSNSISVRVEMPPSVAADISKSEDPLMLIPISIRYYADVPRT